MSEIAGACSHRAANVRTAVEINDVLLPGMDIADPPHSLHDQRALIAAPLRPVHRSIADKSVQEALGSSLLRALSAIRKAGRRAGWREASGRCSTGRSARSTRECTSDRVYDLGRIVPLWQERIGMAGVVSAGRSSFQVGNRLRPRRAGSHRATHRRPPLGIGLVARPWDRVVTTLNNELSWLHVHVEAEVSFCDNRSLVVGATRPRLYSAL